MEVVTVVKLRLSPSKETARILDGQSKISNWLYNHLLERANHLRESTKKINCRRWEKRFIPNEDYVI